MYGLAAKMFALLALHTLSTVGHERLADGWQILSAVHLCKSFKKSTNEGSCSLLRERTLHITTTHDDRRLTSFRTAWLALNLFCARQTVIQKSDDDLAAQPPSSAALKRGRGRE